MPMTTFDALLQDLFSSLNDEEKALVFSLSEEKHFNAKETFQKPGTVCKKIWLIKDGAIRMYRESNNKDYTLHLFTYPRFITDYISVTDKTPGIYFFEALIPSTVLEFNYEKFYGLLHKSSSYEKVARKILERVLYEENARVDEMIFLDATQRYNKLLEKDPQFLQKVPLKHIASYLKISPETLSRIRNASKNID